MFLKTTSIKIENRKLNYLIYEYKNFFIIYYYSEVLFYKLILMKKNILNIFLNFFRINSIYYLLKNINRYYYYEIMLEGLYYRIKYYKKYKSIGFILGYNHYILFFFPKKINIFCNIMRRRFILYGENKSLLGQIAMEIVNLKYPNLFKGRGIKIVNFNYRKKIIIKKK